MTEKPQTLFLQAQECHDKKDWDGAIRYWNQVIDLPEDQISEENRATALSNRGNAFVNKSEFDRAIRDFDHAIRINPDLADAFHNRGNAFAKKGELDRAIRDYDQSLKTKPDDEETLNNRGRVFAEKGELNYAIRDYNHALKLKPDYAEALNNRGLAFADKGELDRAFSDYNHVLKIKPDFAEALDGRGTVFARKGELDRAISDFDHALKIKPDFAETLSNRGAVFAKKGELDTAIRDFDHALKIKPDFAEAFYNRGLAFAKKNDFESALRDFDQALKFKPAYAEANHNRAIVLARGYAQETEKEYKEKHEEQVRQITESFERRLRQTTDPADIAKLYRRRENAYRRIITILDRGITKFTLRLSRILIVGFSVIAIAVSVTWLLLTFGSSDCDIPNCSAHGIVIVNCCLTGRGEVSFAGLLAIAPLTLVLFTACFPLIAQLFNFRKEKRRLQVCIEDYFRKQTLANYTLVAEGEHKQRLIAITHAHFATRSTAEFLAGWKPESEENSHPLTNAIDKAIRGDKNADSSKTTEKSSS